MYYCLARQHYVNGQLRPDLDGKIPSAGEADDIGLQRQSTICELTFPTTVLAVRLNRKRLVVILEDQIYLYDISNMKLLYTIETSPNPNGLVLLSRMNHFLLIHTSYLCPFALLRELLPRLPTPPKSRSLLLRSTISHPT